MRWIIAHVGAGSIKTLNLEQLLMASWTDAQMRLKELWQVHRCDLAMRGHTSLVSQRWRARFYDRAGRRLRSDSVDEASTSRVCSNCV